MLTAELKELISIYSKNLKSEQKGHVTISVLNQFLKKYNKHSISFLDFIRSHEGKSIKHLLTDDFLQSKDPAASIFRTILFPIKKISSADILRFAGDFLDGKSLFSYAIATSLFKKPIMEGPSFNYYKTAYDWKKKLKHLCPSISWKAIIETRIIDDFKHLHGVLLQMGNNSKEIDTYWEIYLLSGEPKAIDYAIDTYKLNENTRNRWGENLFQMAIFSGRIAAVDHVVERFPKINIFQLSNGNRNIFHLAVWSGSAEMIRYIRFLALKHPFPYSLESKDSDNLLPRDFDNNTAQPKRGEVHQALADSHQRILSWEKQRKINLKMRESKEETSAVTHRFRPH